MAASWWWHEALELSSRDSRQVVMLLIPSYLEQIAVTMQRDMLAARHIETL